MAVQSSGLASHGFDHLGDGHTCNEISLMSLEMQLGKARKGELTGRESVRVDDQIWLDTALGERHVNRRPELGADTFLSVTRREFVTDNRFSGDTVLDA